ncbi:SIS domain-containing protein [Candidatus Saccharibacteria bacterium]|jgi:glucose/mannose-6-phosphate isomerase|nr:SIS domain-containing protein [Candidatus Saccharibacteria bacterium]
MLDELKLLEQRDTEKTLDSGVMQPDQLIMEVDVVNRVNFTDQISSLVFVGMGGSALAAEFVQTWLKKEIGIPIEIVKSYNLPPYVDSNTLVIYGSCSGNTEEVLEALEEGKTRDVNRAIIAGGGTLADRAIDESLSHVLLPQIKIQPRMLTFIQVRAILALLDVFKIIDAEPYLNDLASVHDWLKDEAKLWQKSVPTVNNQAKQLAELAVGKTPVFYGGDITKCLTYKWKISWNENAKNVAFYNTYPEVNHNEFIGWTSHPVEKPFIIFDMLSNFEHPRILKRFEISDRLLSGRRPKANTLNLAGDSLLKQLCWGHLLADFTSIYLGILNGVDPGPVPLVTKLKDELARVQ